MQGVPTPKNLQKPIAPRRIRKTEAKKKLEYPVRKAKRAKAGKAGAENKSWTGEKLSELKLFRRLNRKEKDK